MLLVRSLSDSLAVIITCRHYEHFLTEALDSVLQQSVTPNEIIIVDDKPDQTPTKCQEILRHYRWPNLKHIRTEFGDPLKAREAVFQASSSKYLCFLDADDHLGESYLQSGLEQLTSTNASAVYSDIKYFGTEERTTHFRENMPPSRISLGNFMHVGCLVTREAIQTADAFNHPPVGEYQEDWMFWRKILHTGYQITKQRHLYHARLHDTNRSNGLQDRIGYYGMRGIKAATITFAGLHNNHSITDHWGSGDLFINKQDWPQDQIHLILYGTDNGQGLHAFCDYTISSHPDRINHAARTADTDYIFYYDESLQYPENICEQLLRQLDDTIAGAHNTQYDQFKCTIVASTIMKETISTGDIPRSLRVLYV